MNSQFNTAQTNNGVREGKSPPIHKKTPVVGVIGKCPARRIDVFLLHEPQYDINIKRNSSNCAPNDIPPRMTKSDTNASRNYHGDNEQPIRPREPKRGSKMSLVPPALSFCDQDIFGLLTIWLYQHDELGHEEWCQGNDAK